jgi:hypothetical protein
MADVRIDEEKRRFIIKGNGRDEMGVLFGLPSRKWMPSMGVIIAPFTRLNAKHLADKAFAGKVQLTPEVRDYVEALAVAPSSNRTFPSWYAYKTQPFFDQRAALNKVYANDFGALFMKMGVGKSKVAIDFMSASYYERRIEAVVLVCPLTIHAVWGGPNGELATHSPCPVKVVQVDSSFDASSIKPSQDYLLWLLVGVESLSQGRTFDKLMPFLRNYKCGGLVDEASRIKNHAAIRTKRMLEMRNQFKVRLISTGTPSTRSLMDLYSQFEFLDPNIIGVGDYYAFRNRYAVMGGYKGKEIVGYQYVDELMGLIEPYTYICEKPKDLPPQLFTKRTVKMTDEQRKIYDDMRKGKIDGNDVTNVLTRVLRLQQVIGGHYASDDTFAVDPISGRTKRIAGKVHRILPPDKNPKIKALLEVVEEAGDEQIIVWAKFLPEVEDIRSVLAEIGPVAVFTGATSAAERIELKDGFQSGKYRFFVGNAQTGGLGLTLTAGSVMVYYSNTHSLEDRLQSEDRAHRRGQKADRVLYVDLFMEKSVDKIIEESIVEKKDLDVYVREKIKAAGSMTKAFGDVL